MASDRSKEAAPGQSGASGAGGVSGPNAQLVTIFATTVGVERAERIVSDALRELDLEGDKLDEAGMRRVLDALGQREGIIGVTARFALTRRARVRATGKFQVFPTEPPKTGVYRRATPTGDEVYPEDIAAAFGNSIDPPLALDLVRKYWLAAKIAGTTCTRDQALAMLDAMTAEAGKAGVAATFAKARLHMRGGK